MNVQRKVRISAKMLEDFLCGDTRRAKSNCPRDVVVVGASFENEKDTVVLECQSRRGWTDTGLGGQPVFFDVIFDALERSGE